MPWPVGSVCAQGAVHAQQVDVDRLARLRDSTDAPVQGKANPQARTRQDEADEALPPNEQLALGVGQGALLQGSDTSQDQQADTTGTLGGDGWLLNTLAALGVVLGLVFGLRWVLRRGGIVASRMPQGSAVEVLSRTTVAPRNHVLLMRVGARVLVVNDSSAGMRTLAAIDDPEEIAELLGLIDASRQASMTQSFSGVMNRLAGQWSASDTHVPEQMLSENGAGIDDTEGGVGGSVSRVRSRLAALSRKGGARGR